MGGGSSGSNSSPPSDVAPGGGTYPTNLLGQAYNPAWGGGAQSSPGSSFQPMPIQNLTLSPLQTSSPSPTPSGPIQPQDYWLRDFLMRYNQWTAPSDQDHFSF